MPPTSCYFLVHVLWVVEKNQQGVRRFSGPSVVAFMGK